MQNYSVEIADGIFKVRELYTNQVIKSFDQAEDAYEMAFHLEHGGGFASNTPPFFLQAIVVP